jgi:hypothetical protein
MLYRLSYSRSFTDVVHTVRLLCGCNKSLADEGR